MELSLKMLVLNLADKNCKVMRGSFENFWTSSVLTPREVLIYPP